MICNKADGYILVFLLAISHPCYFTNPVTDSLHGINIKDGIHILNHHSQTLQPHTGINILILQLGIVTLPVSIVLGEYVVPYLHETIAFTAYLTIRSVAAILFSPVIVNFGTGTTGACTMLPEIVAFSILIPVKTGNFLCRNTNILIPDFKSLIILKVDGWI